MLNLKHLYYYHIFAQELSTTKASKRLGITPPALSTQLKQLEEFIGIPLIRRVGNAVEITDSGGIVLHYTNQMFSAYEELKSSISFSKDGRGKPFRVGVTQNICSRFAFDVLELIGKSKFSDSDPVRIMFESQENVIKGLSNEEFDMILGSIPDGIVVGKRWLAQTLEFPVRFFAPRSMFRTMDQKSLPELSLDLAQVIKRGNAARISMVLPMKSVLRLEIERALSKQKIKPDRIIECSCADGITQLIDRGDAYGLVPTPSLMDFKAASLLSVLGPIEGYWTHNISIYMQEGAGQVRFPGQGLSERFSDPLHFSSINPVSNF